MNILIVTPSFPSQKNNTYLGKFVLTEALAYSGNKASVRVIMPHYPGSDRKELIGKNIEVIRIRYFWPERFQKLRNPEVPVYDQKTLLAIIQVPFFLFFFSLGVLKQGRWADIIHCQWTLSALFALPAKYLFKKKIVLTARGSDIRLVAGWINQLIHSMVDVAIDCFGPQKWNDAYKRRFRAKYIKLPLILDSRPPGGVPADLLNVLNDPDNIFIIFFIGRLNITNYTLYGHPTATLIYTANRLKRLKKKFHVFYIGGGDRQIQQELEHLVFKNDVADCVSFLGPKANVNDYLPFCDLGSGGVAFSAVSQEYAFFQIPQLLTFNNDNVDTPWRDKDNALFFEAENVGNLLEAILYAMKDLERLKQIGICGHKMMSKYVMDIEKGGAEYLAVYKKLLLK